MKDYVFISYSSKNTAWVKGLTDSFAQNNIAYWKAPDNIPVGSNYAKEIPKAIAECMAMVLLVSKESQESIWVEKEVDVAICERKAIIPVQLDSVPFNDMFRFYLNNVQLISFQDNQDTMRQIVVDRIKELSGNGMIRVKSTGKQQNANASNASDRTQESAKKERSNALRMNKIPITCEICKGDLKQISMGIYRCETCDKEYYDDFQKVRNYLDKHGAAPAVVIARATKVPLKTIDYLFQEEYLEIPSNDAVRMVCSKCGMPIRTGTLCGQCKDSGSTEIQSKKDGWHSKIWRK